LEVRTKRVGVNPMLEKDQSQRILGIVVDRVEQASRFLSGALHVLEAECENTLDGVRPSPDAASDDEHELTLPTRAERWAGRQVGHESVSPRPPGRGSSRWAGNCGAPAGLDPWVGFEGSEAMANAATGSRHCRTSRHGRVATGEG
jgi:hypothetical protein